MCARSEKLSTTNLSGVGPAPGREQSGEGGGLGRRRAAKPPLVTLLLQAEAAINAQIPVCWVQVMWQESSPGREVGPSPGSVVGFEVDGPELPSRGLKWLGLDRLARPIQLMAVEPNPEAADPRVRCFRESCVGVRSERRLCHAACHEMREQGCAPCAPVACSGSALCSSEQCEHLT